MKIKGILEAETNRPNRSESKSVHVKGSHEWTANCLPR